MRGYWLNNKPPAGVEIDWGHRLTAGLKRCWLWNAGSGGGSDSGRDLVQGERALFGGSSGSYSYVGSGRGVVLNCASGGSGAASFNGVVTGTTFTIEQWWLLRSFPTTYASFMANASASIGFYRAPTGVMSYYYSGDHLSTTVMATGVWNHCVLSVTAGAGTFYLNGQADGTMTSVVTATMVGLGSDFSSNRVDGQNELTRIWIGRALTAGDVAELYRDRYGMMLPPMWRRSFVGEAPVAPSAVSYPRLERFHPRGLNRGMYP